MMKKLTCVLVLLASFAMARADISRRSGSDDTAIQNGVSGSHCSEVTGTLGEQCFDWIDFTLKCFNGATWQPCVTTSVTTASAMSGAAPTVTVTGSAFPWLFGASSLTCLSGGSSGQCKFISPGDWYMIPSSTGLLRIDFGNTGSPQYTFKIPLTPCASGNVLTWDTSGGVSGFICAASTGGATSAGSVNNLQTSNGSGGFGFLSTLIDGSSNVTFPAGITTTAINGARGATLQDNSVDPAVPASGLSMWYTKSLVPYFLPYGGTAPGSYFATIPSAAPGAAGTLYTSSTGAPLTPATGVTASSTAGGTLTVGGPLNVSGALSLNSGTYTYAADATHDLDGDGTANGAYLSGTMSTSESGQRTQGTYYYDRIYTPRSTQETVGVHASNIASARAHAARYSTNPNLYLQGGVVNIASDLLLDSPWVANSHTVQDTLSAGAPNDTDSNYLCLSSNSTSLATKDVIVIGNKVTGTPTGRGHLIWGVTPSSASCGGTKVKLDIFPGIHAADNGSASAISTTWGDSGHFVPEVYWGIGYKLGTASLARDGVQGRDVLTNGAADMYGTVPQGWQAVTGTLGAHGWTNTPGTSVNTCREGLSTAYSCFDISGDSTSYLVTPARTDTPAWVNVVPGQFWTASGWTKGCLSGDKVELETDYNNDGTLEHSVDIASDGTLDLPARTFTSNDSSYDCIHWKPFHKTWQIPDGVHQVRLSVKRAGATALYLDNLSFRQTDVLQADDDTAVTQYLINDPGDRCIAIIGDSHAVDYGDANGDGTSATGDGYGSYIKLGLSSALQTRFGRSVASQIFVRGKSGITASRLLTATDCNHTSGSVGAGSLNCWYESVEGVDCLYYIVVISSVNDVPSGVTPATWRDNILAIKAGIQRIGGIPIFVTPAPHGTAAGNPTGAYDATKDYNASHQLIGVTLQTLKNSTP